jgi:hypothetical protein
MRQTREAGHEYLLIVPHARLITIEDSDWWTTTEISEGGELPHSPFQFCSPLLFVAIPFVESFCIDLMAHS